MNVGGT